MLYQLQPGDTIQSAAKVFGYTDYQQFFKTMRYVGDRKTFTPGTVIECPSALPTPRDRPFTDEPDSILGLRGKAFIQGLTMRDLADCFAAAIGADILEPLAAEQSEWINNFADEVERMMGHEG